MKSLRRIAIGFTAVAMLAAALSVSGLITSKKAHAQADVLSGILQRLSRIGGYPPNSTPEIQSSGNVANATASAALPATAGVTNFIYGFDVYGTGATAASVVNCTVAGTASTGTPTFAQAVPAGATTAITPTLVRFPEPLPASAVNTAITVSCPAFGSGNTNASVNVYGFQSTIAP